MQRELIDLFQGFSKRGEWVFSKPDGTPYDHWNIFKPFRKVLRSLGIDTKQYSWKELRHTTASLMHLKGVPALAIKDQLRHTTVKTTEGFYIGSDIEYQRQQAEKLALNSGKPGFYWNKHHCKCLKYLARLRGFEPPTHGLEVSKWLSMISIS